MGNRTKFYVDIMATHPEVTGSCIFCNVCFPDGRRVKFLVDCGLFQEERYEDYNLDFPFKAGNIDFVVLTHNHIDHIGRIPLLKKLGFNKKIYATYPTSRFMSNALYDTERIIKKWAKKKNKRQLFVKEDVADSLNLVQPCDYFESVEVDPNIKVTFFKNAHLVGASIVLFQLSYPNKEDINLLFTGDYNEKDKNIFIDVPSLPDWVKDLKLTVVQESTYGYKDSVEVEKCFANNIEKACKEDKTIIIPVFSLGRAQEILYHLKCLQEEGKISLSIPIYLDGKLAIKYTNLYLNDPNLGLKDDMKDFLPKHFKFVDYDTREELVRDHHNPKVIVTTSGMGSFGPAQRYIPIFLKDENTLIHFTGYTTEGTLGQRLRDANEGELVSVSGLLVKKEAEVKFTAEFSSHAKADQMIDFLKQFSQLRFVLVNHGENKSKEIFSERIYNEVSPKGIGIMNRDYMFRVDSYGFVKSIPTKLR